MKYLKVEEFIKRTASVTETDHLLQELENYVKGRPGLQGRTLCDRVIRACNHQLGVGSPDLDRVSQLLKLVELALHGYDTSGVHVPQSNPLYMEKIIFHIVKKLSSLKVYTLCQHLAGLLYRRLNPPQQAEDYWVLVRSCFSVLWNGLSAEKDKTILSPWDKLHCQMQTLGFLFLLSSESTGSPSNSKVPIYAEDALTEFERNCGTVTKDDTSFLVQESHALFKSCLTYSRGCEENGSGQSELFILYALSEMVLIIVKTLCKAGHYDMALSVLNDIENKVTDYTHFNCIALMLGKWAVKIHCSMTAGKENAQAFAQCTRILRSLSVQLEHREAHVVLEGCSLVVWTVESCSSKGLSGAGLLAWFSFLEEHQEQIIKLLKNVTESSSFQQALCFSFYQGFVMAYESMLASQLENSDTLDRVLLYCQATAGQMMTELRKTSNESLLIKAVIAVSNLACGLYNKRLYDEAFILVEILCRDLCKNCPESLSVDRLSRPFMLAVQTSRRAGHLERALNWVILWLKALGDKITTHMAEPVSLWVKTKIDASRNDQEDIRLRTVRDGFGPDTPNEEVMLCLLEEELRAYKEVAGDTSQERYNTLCDLLDICHEESTHTHLRAVYLCEMAQVVCFQDFSEQTDCMAVDFTHEALRLLEEEPVTFKNADRLKDDKAHALLWLYICTIEKNLQEAIDKDKKLRELRQQSQSLANPAEINDFDYEDKQKMHDSTLVYEGLHFNLAAENKLCQPLEQALDEWSSLLQCKILPSVSNPKQTCSSIAVMAALFRLMGKPLKALEAYQLVIGLSHQLADAKTCASNLCQSTSLFLCMGTPQLALAQLEQAEKLLLSDSAADGPSSISMLVILLKAQYCYSTGEVECGVSYLCEVLKEVNEQRQSKSWYLLRARAFQTCSSYLSLDTAALPQVQRSRITQHGMISPDAALYESLKLLCSLLVTLVGKGLYGANGSTSDVHFINHGDNLLMKWELLSELLHCSVQMVAMRSSCGAINDARLQCLEALKLAMKLQALRPCAELLVVKAELELMQGEREECGFDLDKVRNLLELCTDFSDKEQKSELKIKPKKGRPTTKSHSPLLTTDDNCNGILSTRWIPKEPIERELSSSPPLKNKPCRWLSSLTHMPDCPCPCCSEPSLGYITARWAATQADLIVQLDPADVRVGLKLHWATLSRCKNVTSKVAVKLASLVSLHGPLKDIKPSLMQEVMGRIYVHMALFGLELRFDKVCSLWKILEAGLAFVGSMPSPVLRPMKAALMFIKSIMSLVNLADKSNCTIEELFSSVWTWNVPKEQKCKEEFMRLPSKNAKDFTVKNQDTAVKAIEARKVKAVRPKIQVTSSKSKIKYNAVPKTPVVTKSKPTAGELGSFNFNTVVPTLTCTPVQKVKATVSAQKAVKAAPKIQFHVYAELSPVQDRAQPVPAAPRRTKKSRFKIEFSDESDTEGNTQRELKVNMDVPQKSSSNRNATHKLKTASAPSLERNLPKRRTKTKKGVGLFTSSEDEEFEVCQRPSTRSGRTRRKVPGLEADSVEEPDKMRTIDEEIEEILDMSIEQFRISDPETEDSQASNKDSDFEVLRRDVGSSMGKEDLPKLMSRGYLRGQQTPLSHSDITPEALSLEDVQSWLCSTWLSFQHFPPPTIFPTLSALLALTTGQQDPVTTAMLHSHALGVTSRHRMIKHLASCLKKLRKTSSDPADRVDALSLDEPDPPESGTPIEQKLSQLENIFSFTAVDTSSFPQSHCQEFIQKIQHLPSGVTVCMMSMVGFKPGEMGNSILLSRVEKGSSPVTVHIPTSKQQHPVSWLVQEMDSIQVEQKAVSCVCEKAKWWEGRKALDFRVERLLKEMEGLLGCWRSLLLPLTSNSKLSSEAQCLFEALSARGVTVSEEMIKVVLSAAPDLSKEELKRFALGIFPQWDVECEQLFHTAVSRVKGGDESNGHVVFILDKYLQKLPWESMSVLRSRSVSRMPSLHSLIALSIQKETDPQSVLKQGVDSRCAFYVLDPDANLENSQNTFKEWFSSLPSWEGVYGVAPDLGQLTEAVATKDLYIYIGHGAGARFLDGQTVLKRQMRAASLLFGCSSAALAVRGNQEGQGIILNYIMAGCPFVLGNLWDVTDRDIDRFTKALLESWLSAGPGAALLDYMGPSRQATNLKHLIGAAPVVYGLPVHLQHHGLQSC